VRLDAKHALANGVKRGLRRACERHDELHCLVNARAICVLGSWCHDNVKVVNPEECFCDVFVAVVDLTV